MFSQHLHGHSSCITTLQPKTPKISHAITLINSNNKILQAEKQNHIKDQNMQAAKHNVHLYLMANKQNRKSLTPETAPQKHNKQIIKHEKNSTILIKSPSPLRKLKSNVTKTRNIQNKENISPNHVKGLPTQSPSRLRSNDKLNRPQNMQLPVEKVKPTKINSTREISHTSRKFKINSDGCINFNQNTAVIDFNPNLTSTKNSTSSSTNTVNAPQASSILQNMSTTTKLYNAIHQQKKETLFQNTNNNHCISSAYHVETNFQMEETILIVLLKIDHLIDNLYNAFKNGGDLFKHAQDYLKEIQKNTLDGIEMMFEGQRNRKMIRMSLLLERLSIFMLYYFSLFPEKIKNFQLHLRNIVHYSYRNFLIFIEELLSKLLLHKHYQNYVHEFKTTLAKKKLKVFTNCTQQTDSFTQLKQGNEILISLIKCCSKEMGFLHMKISNFVKNLDKYTLAKGIHEYVSIFSDISNQKGVSIEKNHIEEDKEPKDPGSNSKYSSNKSSFIEAMIAREIDVIPTTENVSNKHTEMIKNTNQITEDMLFCDEETTFHDQEKKAKFLLPPIKNGKKYTLVLDLDETLVHFQGEGDVGQFFVRPYAQEFLEILNNRFEIVIFTAAVREYADWILDRLDVNNYISHRLYRNHTLWYRGLYLKDLSLLGRDLSKTIIIDNVAENFQLQPNNGIFIKSWVDDPSDRALLDLCPILQDIAKNDVNDVRECLRKLRDQMIKNAPTFSNDNIDHILKLMR